MFQTITKMREIIKGFGLIDDDIPDINVPVLKPTKYKPPKVIKPPKVHYDNSYVDWLISYIPEKNKTTNCSKS